MLKFMYIYYTQTTMPSRIINLQTGINSSKFFANMDGSSEPCIKKALVAVEGNFDDSEGTPFTFDANRLNAIADFTNKALENGQIIPVCTDHSVTVDNTVGAIEGSAFTKVITSADLPNPKAQDLIGKLGLFVDNVVIKGQAAVEKVRDNVVRSVSMGLNLDPNDHRIMELSLVPIPAIPNMGLFTKTRASFAGGATTDLTANAFTWEELELNQKSLDDLREEFDSLVENLWGILTNIYTSDSIEIQDFNQLRQYVYSALNGYSTRVVELLGLDEQEKEHNQTEPTAETQSADMAAMQTETRAQDGTFSRPYVIGKFAAKADQGLLELNAYKGLGI